MWGANIALGAMAVALLWLNHREAAFDPLDPAHYLAWMPKVRRQRRRAPAACAGAAARRARSSWCASRACGCASPPSSTATSSRAWVANVALVLLAFASIYFLGDFMDLIDDFQQNKPGPP